MKAMKRHILPLLLVLACTATFPGCSTDELPVTDPAAGNGTTVAFTITVSDGGYALSDADPHTRAKENSYKTTFTAGDKIGVFAVKNGEIVNGVNNLCLTAHDSDDGLVWTDDNGIAPADVFGDVTYYAYYPWKQSLTGELVPGATNADAFFANVISNWMPATDQSTYAEYTAQDLMIAGSITVPGRRLSFSMTHKMALVVIDLPRTKYVFANTDPLIPDYIIDAPGTQFTGFTPCRMSDGTYRYLVTPSASSTLSGSYTNSDTKTWSFSPSSVSAGNYKVFQVDRATVTEVEHTLTVGDFYMKDGSLLPASTGQLTDEQKAACLGIVLKVGRGTDEGKNGTDSDNSRNWTDTDTYMDKNNRDMTTIHGYVLALQNANGKQTTSWGVVTEVVGTNQSQYTLFCGYSNTQRIKEKAASMGKNLLDAFPAAYYASVGYETIENGKYSSPSSSSGWFLPSAGQCWYWNRNRNREALHASMQKVAGHEGSNDMYWSSSECGGNLNPAAENAWIMSLHYQNVQTNRKDDGNQGNIRSFLAF